MSPEGVAELCALARKIPKGTPLAVRNSGSNDDLVYNVILLAEGRISYADIVSKLDNLSSSQISNALSRLLKSYSIVRYGKTRNIFYDVA